MRAKDNAGYWGQTDHYKVQIFSPGWVSPTGHVSSSDWDNEQYAYDESTSTKATCEITSSGWQWTPFIELTLD